MEKEVKGNLHLYKCNDTDFSIFSMTYYWRLLIRQWLREILQVKADYI